jgi:ketosteroid isomerase-like protein
MTDTQSSQTATVVERFNDALNAHDIDTVMALMTSDCVFENTFPAPDGERYEGQGPVRAFWERLIAGSPKAHFACEELVAMGDRCVVRWRYTRSNADGDGHIRGIDLFTIRDGKVAEKLAYVKG